MSVKDNNEAEKGQQNAAQVFGERHCTIGEGPHWQAGEQCLYYVDIPAGRMHRFDPEAKTLHTADVRMHE